MSRPRQNNAEWFSHDASLRNDLRVKAFRSKHQAEGYGIFQMILEVFAGSTNCWIAFTDEVLELISLDLCIELEKLKEIIDSLVGKKIFVIENGFLSCPMLDEAVAQLFIDRGRPLLEQREMQLHGEDFKKKEKKIA